MEKMGEGKFKEGEREREWRRRKNNYLEKGYRLGRPNLRRNPWTERERGYKGEENGKKTRKKGFKSKPCAPSVGPSKTLKKIIIIKIVESRICSRSSSSVNRTTTFLAATNRKPKHVLLRKPSHLKLLCPETIFSASRRSSLIEMVLNFLYFFVSKIRSHICII